MIEQPDHPPILSVEARMIDVLNEIDRMAQKMHGTRALYIAQMDYILRRHYLQIARQQAELEYAHEQEYWDNDRQEDWKDAQ